MPGMTNRLMMMHVMLEERDAIKQIKKLDLHTDYPLSLLEVRIKMTEMFHLNLCTRNLLALV